MTELRAGGATHVGQVRSSNQDAYVIDDGATLYGVADGMGGHKGGEVASAIAIDTLKEHATTASLEDLREAARKGNRAIFEKAGAESGLHGMGTTLCAVRVVEGPEGDEIGWINVGDSRIYLFRDDRLLQLSRDHSLVEDLLRDGQLTEDEAKVHPKRNIITRALGIDVDVDVDASTVIPFNGDRYLLCSDGLFGEVSDDQITSVLRRLSDPTEAADELVRLANEAGGRDNITVVVVEVVDDGGRSLLAAEALAAQESRLKARQEEDEALMAAARAAAGADEEPEPYVPAMADRRSSLPDAPEDLRSEKEDLYEDLEGLDSKRFTWRVVVFAIAIVAVIAVILGAIVWSGTSSYYVAFKGDRVVLYQGKPGGVLWIKPSYDQDTPLTRDQLSESDRKAIADNKAFGSKADALTYILKLQTSATATTTTTTTTTTSTTTTAPTTTTTAPAATTTAAPTTTRP
ncbi:MAG: Stp1/IreP family PP2C-type Ser/Thr phosphatase [Acidimicrobiales bacterium]